MVSVTADTAMKPFITDDQYNMGILNSSCGNSSRMHFVIREHQQLNEMADGVDLSTERARRPTEAGASDCAVRA